MILYFLILSTFFFSHSFGIARIVSVLGSFHWSCCSRWSCQSAGPMGLPCSSMKMAVWSGPASPVYLPPTSPIAAPQGLIGPSPCLPWPSCWAWLWILGGWNFEGDFTIFHHSLGYPISSNIIKHIGYIWVIWGSKNNFDKWWLVRD